MHEILWCDHSYETCSPVLSHGAIQYSTFESAHEFLWCDLSYETCLAVLYKDLWTLPFLKNSQKLEYWQS